jgi:hypothetical protein
VRRPPIFSDLDKDTASVVAGGTPHDAPVSVADRQLPVADQVAKQWFSSERMFVALCDRVTLRREAFRFAASRTRVPAS